MKSRVEQPTTHVSSEGPVMVTAPRISPLNWNFFIISDDLFMVVGFEQISNSGMGKADQSPSF